MRDKIILTDNGKKLLSFLQENDKIWVGKDLIELTKIKGIYPVLNSLIFNGLVVHADPVSRIVTNSKGEQKSYDYKTYELTEMGRYFKEEVN